MRDEVSDKDSTFGSMLDVNEPWERQYWSRFFGVSELELKEAVAAVGSRAEALRKHFRSTPKEAR
jgi:hypothetical protein